MLAMSNEMIVRGEKCKAAYEVKAVMAEFGNEDNGDLSIALFYIPVNGNLPKNRYTKNIIKEYYENYEIAYRVAINLREELGLKGFLGTEEKLQKEIAYRNDYLDNFKILNIDEFYGAKKRTA